MSRLLNFAACCKKQCEWKCCATNENDEVNMKNFTHNIRIQNNVLYSNLYEVPLISERAVYLNEKTRTIMKIGCSPHRKFEVVAQLETTTKNFVTFTSDEMLNLIEVLSKNFNENDYWKSAYEEKICQHITTGMKYLFELKTIDLRTVGLRIGRKYCTIDEESLYTILRKKTFIQNHIFVLESMRKSYETMLFDLASHFCYDNKSLKLVTEFSNSKYYVQQFFNEILNFHCNCIDKSFVIDMGANFSEWFAKCIPVFIYTKMLSEEQRLKTFSNNDWPHKKNVINVKNLAKSGLFYTGKNDLVACAFCRVQLHEWQPEDDPIVDHRKYSPKCSFLLDPLRTQNVPIGKPSKITDLIQTLSRDDEKEEEITYDDVYEIDGPISNN